MKIPPQSTVVSDYLAQLARRVRWKRSLRRLSRSAGLIAAVFLFAYGADLAFGLDTMMLRIASGAFLLGSALLLAFDVARSSLVRLDSIGVAQLVEKRSPGLAERLVTLVQIQRDPSGTLDPEFVYFLGIETERQLAAIPPAAACPLQREGRFAAITVVVLTSLFGALGYVPSFDLFAARFFDSWETSAEPFVVHLNCSESYGDEIERIECDGKVIELSRLDRHVYSFAAHCRLLDKRAKKPAECWLVCGDGAEPTARIRMTPFNAMSVGQFSCEISDPPESRSYWAEADGIGSRSVLVVPIERPAFTEAPTVVVTVPRYANQAASAPVRLDPTTGDALDVLRFSRINFAFVLSRESRAGWLRVNKLSASEHEVPEVLVAKLAFTGEEHRGVAEIIAAKPGNFRAEVILEIAQNLCVVLPVGQWKVHDDQAPRFTQPVRAAGAGEILKREGEARITPGDSLKLQTVVEDQEGLDAVAVEYRVNDGPVRAEVWKRAVGKKLLTLNDWLPLPTGLKDGDRVQFRLRASDNRRLKKGEIVQHEQLPLPAEDLGSQITTWPATAGGEAQWITLRLDRSAGGLLKDQVNTQAVEVRDQVAKIRQKLLAEAQHLEKLQRTVHQQVALAPEQKQQADKIRKLNREITEDLLRAGERFAANPDLARLADHFFEIAETELLRSAEALNRFSEKDRPLADGEKDLQTSQDAVQQAVKKLDRMNDLNKLLAQDRIDQWQIEKLAHRQEMLAQQLKNLLKNEPLSDVELARQIEAIRQEQAKLAEQRMELEHQNALVKESEDALAQMNAVERLAQKAQQLAAEQRKMREPDSGKMLGEKTDMLAADLKELTQNTGGPEAKAMAKESADTLDQAKKAMAASEARKAKGDAENAKIADDEAAKKLDIVVKQLAKLAQDPTMKLPGKDGAEKTAEALKDSGKLMKAAEDMLPNMPKDAQLAMKRAAQKLAEAAELAQQKASRHLPKIARNPNAKTVIPLGSAGSSVLGKDSKMELFQGKTWGELPGELKTRLMQDFRSRFGEAYADMIQQYFERLAEPPPARK